MAKIKAFEINKTILILIGICAPPIETALSKRISYIFVFIIICSISTITIVTSTAYILEFRSTDFVGTLLTGIQTLAAISTFFSMVTAFQFRSKLAENFQKFQQTCDKSNYDEPHIRYILKLNTIQL